MKKIMLASAIAATMMGCATTEKPSVENNAQETSTSEELFYNAFLGEIMESEGQTNNAIKHYESIIANDYEPDYFEKLIKLYKYKNDVVSVKNLILDLDIDTLNKNHSEYVFLRHLLDNDTDAAASFFHSELNNDEVLSEDKMKHYNQIYNLYSNELVLYFQGEQIIDNFLNELESVDENEYQFLARHIEGNGSVQAKNIEKPYTDEDFTGVEGDTILLLKAASSNNYDILLQTFDANYIDKDIQETLINSYANYYSSKGMFEKNHQLFIDVEKNKNVEITEQLMISDAVYYFYTFQPNDGLYKLEQVKDSISPSYYYMMKAMQNYMLGYKKAAKKYFAKIEESDALLKYSNQYFELFGKEGLDKFGFDEVDKGLVAFSYYKNTGDIIKAEEEISNLKEIVDESGDSYSSIRDMVEFEMLNMKSPKQALELLYSKIPNDLEKGFFNDYIYYSTSLNINKEKVDELVIDYNEELNKSPSFIDTKAYYLLQNGKADEALELVKKFNLEYYHNKEVQDNIVNIYKALGNKKEAKRHQGYSDMLKGVKSH